ncbi:MAG: hypothetical protein M3040_15090 [Bacteroidota bacterium]|nr:hypothetical protein [Bacteroidota bacterium]
MNNEQNEEESASLNELDLSNAEQIPAMLIIPRASGEKSDLASSSPGSSGGLPPVLTPRPPIVLNPPILLPPIVLPPFVPWGIAGVEATQATQFFLINGQGSGAAPNNSVPSVANKVLILRVYPRKGVILASPAQVTGVVSRPGKPDLLPINGPVAVQDTSAIQRVNANHSLNFRIPAADCVGTVTFTIKLINTTLATDFRMTTITRTFDVVPQVRVHGVLIHYTGRGMNIANPTGIDLINTLAWVGLTYPISGFNYTACNVTDFNGDLTVGGGGGCGTGWNVLFNMLWTMRSASGTNDVFIGLLPAGVPTSGVIGCGGGGVAIAYNGGGTVLAQEVGHAFGRAHAPCGNPGGPDPNYPHYNSYPSGSIGEFGVNTSNMQIFNPSSTYDFMSYCGPVWVSPYTYTGLKNAIVATPAAAHPERAGSEADALPGEYLFISFRMDQGGQVEVMNSFHLYTPKPPQEVGIETSVSCSLLNKKGQVILTHHCRLTNPHHDENAASAEFYEALPWSKDIAKITFMRNGKVSHTSEVDEHAPGVNFVTTKKLLERRTELMRLEWNIKQDQGVVKSQKAVKYILRYSNNAGSTWRAVTADIEENSHVVNLNTLPGGDQCLFQIVASSGMRTSTATTEPFAVDRKPYEAHILSPKSSDNFKKGADVRLYGGGFSPDFGTIDFDYVTWTSDRDGLLGTGYEVITNKLSSGRHRISINLPDGLGGDVSASVYIQIGTE